MTLIGQQPSQGSTGQERGVERLGSHTHVTEEENHRQGGNLSKDYSGCMHGV